MNTARHLIETIPGKTDKVESVKTMLAEWSRKWHWVDRVEAYEIAEDRRLRLERQARQRTMEERHLAGADRLLIAALARLGGSDEMGVTALHPDQIADYGEASQVLERAVRVGRLTLGMPTDLGKQLDAWTNQEVMRLAHSVIDTMLHFIPEEQHHEAVSRVRDVFVGWGRR
jgi:hypothetical protein